MPPSTAKYRFSLYVAGRSPNSVQAIANFRRYCEAHVRLPFTLELVDLLETPERCFKDGIFVTPTLVLTHPGPHRKVIGDLSDFSQLNAALELELGVAE